MPFQTVHPEIVDRIVDEVARAQYLAQRTPESPYPDSVAEGMRGIVRGTVEATLEALRGIAYRPDGSCDLDRPAEVALRLSHNRERPIAEQWGRFAEAAVDTVLDNLGILPIDPRP